MHASSDSVIIVDINAPAAFVAQHKWQPNTPDGQGAPFLFHHGKAAASSSGGGLMRMFKGQAGAVSEDWHFPQALAYPTSGIRSSAIVAITNSKEIITGMYSSLLLYTWVMLILMTCVIQSCVLHILSFSIILKFIERTLTENSIMCHEEEQGFKNTHLYDYYAKLS